jgi:hypothetical protein
VVGVHSYRHSVRVYPHYLDTLDHRFSSPSRFFDNVSVAELKDELTLRELGTTLRHGIAHFKDQPMSINILNNANDSRVLKVDVGNISGHVA